MFNMLCKDETIIISIYCKHNTIGLLNVTMFAGFKVVHNIPCDKKFVNQMILLLKEIFAIFEYYISTDYIV